ncbi:hypothetical protein FPCIR_888 [Fusarium pseudocircinatum]|uniref:Apple domain-containing protein n=1 Tax=Fusarium pseudocircinatum TaxID=56676 RepID=A0A8H5PXN5_9HYPO|nr:hypothetical protein FPCIR_888 [Fusarium pseudocircinatum]
MVAIHSFLSLSVAVGIASAGKCKPERSSSIVSVPSSTVSASVSVIESTTLADTTMETSLTESATETASSETDSASGSGSATLIESSTTLVDTTVETSIAESTGSSATSADVSTTESKPTTFLTSFTTSNADTTTEAATTTSVAPGPVVSCPSEVDQCLGTMEIQCNVLPGGLNSPRILDDMNDCAQKCNSDTTCRAFTYNEYMHECFIITTQEIVPVNIGGWVAGIKGTCVENTESSSTVFTSTAETTTTEAAATTTTLAPADPTCPSTVKQCAGDSAVLCDVQLNDLTLAGFSKDILECASFCDDDDECAGFSRVRSSGGCFKALTAIASVTKIDREGWDSGIKLSCGQQPEPTTTAFTSTAETTTTEAATTTTAAAPVDNCPLEAGMCIFTSRIQCDVRLDGLTLTGGGSIAQCAQLCAYSDTCTGFSRRREDGACFITTSGSVTSSEGEGWDSGILYSCAA